MLLSLYVILLWCRAAAHVSGRCATLVRRVQLVCSSNSRARPFPRPRLSLEMWAVPRFTPCKFSLLVHSLRSWQAYGQANTGKSALMRGSVDDPGIIPRVVSQLFAWREHEDIVLTYAYPLHVLLLFLYSWG
jgi:hypothetical protein